jgi:phytoene/squalene synthetase
MLSLFDEISFQCSQITTERYSTSFSSAIKLLHKDLHEPIYNIYGFVRFADEIVDTFHEYDKRSLLQDFKKETYLSFERGISLNPILNSFQKVVNQYKIDTALVDAFFASMESDLDNQQYDEQGYKNYIYGSAEVVGLMCLYVFCEGDLNEYEKLKPYAMALGSAFQKINFLRDVKADSQVLNRVYFPNVDFSNFTAIIKKEIEADIATDFKKGYEGILMLPKKARFGVYVAYQYYISLFEKIKKSEPANLLESRIRVPDISKAFILMSAKFKSQLNLL